MKQNKIKTKELEIICIYNSNGDFMGELKYIWDVVFNNFKCSMCEITHKFVSIKNEWKVAVKNSKYEVSARHLNDRPDSIKDLTDNKTPCVVKTENGLSSIMINSQELLGLKGDVESFFKLIDGKILKN
tara:strand:+ start:35 stop:421 length:387 start_codon:yes stop_codon:yes gene_type:complete